MRPLHRLLPALCVLLAPLGAARTAAAATPAASPAAQDVTADLPDIKDTLDPTLRWLRGRQDRPAGSYGGSVEGTAWALRAFAESPRHYRSADGAFVRDAVRWLVAQQAEDGAIADPGTEGDARVASTRLATAALFPFAEETRGAYGEALAFVSAHEDAVGALPTYADTKEEAARRVLKLVADRGPDHTWGDGDLVTTCKNAVELASYAKLVKKPKGEPRPTRALPNWSVEDARKADEAILKGARFLEGLALEPGRWGSPEGPDAGLTAMVLGALHAVPTPRPEGLQRSIDAGLAWLASLQHEDGGIHQGRLANYTTSAAVLALTADGREEFAPVVEKARAYLVALQADEGEGYSEGDRYYGGIGYGGDERPDLSNLQMALEALAASGLEQDHAAYSRAVKFLERCQNRSESNDVTIVDGDVVIRSGDDGGAGYMPGDSKAGFDVKMEDGTTVHVPRSYGSMTYALLKSFVFAGLEKDDPRVVGAWQWLQGHYTLDVNPGFEAAEDPNAPYQGLFYYFHSMARALDVYGEDHVTTPDGTAHPWRVELAARLVSMQDRTDGSWVNTNAPRWWEGNPLLATSYALMALESCRAE